MNPWPMARVALRRRWRSASLMALLVAVALALGIAVGALERASRRAAARAADTFDLIVGAPGGPAQLVLAAVYLQPESVPLLDPAVAAKVLAEPEARWSSPIGFGDSWRGHPVVGVAPAFLAEAFASPRPLAQGRPFAAEEEAVAGAAVPLALGDTFSPMHGLVETREGHVHGEIGYRIVGRLAPTGTPWDRALLVPIESVWELHGLGNGHPPGVERIGSPWEQPAGVPAIVVKPRSIAGAYQLRARYRTTSSTAIFPGEVLSGLFRTLGDVRSVLSAMAGATSALVVVAILLAFTALVAGRAREHAVLRAIGAPPSFIIGALWLELSAIMLAGCGGGLLLGWVGAVIAARSLERAAGFTIRVSLGGPDYTLGLATLAAALAAATIPALLSSRLSPGATLKR